jgi:hypothetical protein
MFRGDVGSSIIARKGANIQSEKWDASERNLTTLPREAPRLRRLPLPVTARPGPGQQKARQ